MFTMLLKYLLQYSPLHPLLSPGMWPKPYTTTTKFIAHLRTWHPRLPTCKSDYKLEISGILAAASPGIWKRTDNSTFTSARRVEMLEFQISFLIEQGIIEPGVIIDYSSTGHGRSFDQGPPISSIIRSWGSLDQIMIEHRLHDLLDHDRGHH